jgi:hypothetical protein
MNKPFKNHLVVKFEVSFNGKMSNDEMNHSSNENVHEDKILALM